VGDEVPLPYLNYLATIHRLRRGESPEPITYEPGPVPSFRPGAGTGHVAPHTPANGVVPLAPPGAKKSDMPGRRSAGTCRPEN